MDGYLTIKEAAERLGIKPGALLRRVQRGYVKGKKLGWVWLIPEEEVERLSSHANH
jgi:excisionase family DNA binding protein